MNDKYRNKSMHTGKYGVVYLLKKHGDVVYVGQSINLLSRINQHKGDKDFDEVEWYEIASKGRRNVVESILIALHNCDLNLHRPQYHTHLPSETRRTA